MKLDRMSGSSVNLTQNDVRALTLLAGSPQGVSVPILLTAGFQLDQLASLVRHGLATVERSGRRQKDAKLLRITYAGRQAIGRALTMLASPLAPTLDQGQGAVPRKLGGMETL
jgi:hypothetical protein